MVENMRTNELIDKALNMTSRFGVECYTSEELNNMFNELNKKMKLKTISSETYSTLLRLSDKIHSQTVIRTYPYDKYIGENKILGIDNLEVLEYVFENIGFKAVVELSREGMINPNTYDAFYEKHIDLY